MVEYEYAKALFDLAIEEKKVELFLDYLEAIVDTASSQKDYYKMMSSQLISKEEKTKTIENVYGAFDSTFLNFLKILIQNDRFDRIDNICEEYHKLFSDYNNILKVEIISSEKLGKDRLALVKKSLEKRYANKKLVIIESVNPKILYGLQIICNGESIDMSLKNMLNKMKNSL